MMTQGRGAKQESQEDPHGSLGPALVLVPWELD